MFIVMICDMFCFCIVMLISCCVIFIVILLCEMNRNCVLLDIVCMRFVNCLVFVLLSGVLILLSR